MHKIKSIERVMLENSKTEKGHHGSEKKPR